MRKTVMATLAFVAAAFVAAGGGSASTTYENLNPGGPADLPEQVPVNFVFVGLEPDQVNQQEFLAGLPQTYDPVVRSRLWYGVTEKLGLHYTFDYKVTYADSAYENAFFGFLASEATPADRTLFQDMYNAQLKNVRDVGQNHYIDAPTVEKWLIANPPAGVDTSRNTEYFVNWYGRDGFKFHVYTKFGEPDPDTRYDFGIERDSRKIVAWGGTAPDDEETGRANGSIGRIWFYDLSAGPEAWGGSYNVDDHDIDGDGITDYRIPVIWEYTKQRTNGFRDPSALTDDLSKVARYGAINLLFTPSPLYPPYITPDSQPGSLNLDMNTFEGIAGTHAADKYQTPELLEEETADLLRVPVTIDQEEEPLAGKAAECYTKFLNSAKCYPEHANYHYFANLFLYGALNIGDYHDGGADYESVHFNYASDTPAPYLGFADDNWIDGTQSFTFNFVSPAIESYGYGLTTTQIHEGGHHYGMSHPHDGYDSETGVSYGPSGSYFFAWLTDEVNSMMSYIDLNWDFSQFDRDNWDRYTAAAYVINANAIAGDIVASPNAANASADLLAADAEIGLAKQALAAHDYAGAFEHAKLAYGHVVSGAAKADVTVERSTNGWTVMPERKDWKGPVARQHYSYEDRIGPGTKRSLE